MVASTDVKFFVHTNNNAPQLQNAYGSMINVLNAALVDGIFIGNIAALTVVGVTATATFTTPHNLMQYQILKIAGANQAEFNKEFKILSVPNTTTVTFELESVPSVTTATGSMSASLPPLGWEKPFSSTNASGGGKAAYRSKNLLLASRPFLRVVDELDQSWNTAYAKYAKVGIVEEMSDIDTMLGVQAPYDSTLPDKNWVGSGSSMNAYNGWAKWYYASSTMVATTADTGTVSNGDREYIIVGNSDYFFILPKSSPPPYTSDTYNFTYGFGAFESLLNVDNANTFLSATVNYAIASTGVLRGTYGNLCSNTNSATNRIVIHRPYNMQAASIYGRIVSLGAGFATNSITSGATDLVAASTLTNISPLSPIFLQEVTSLVLRGKINGFYWLFQQLPFTHKQIFAQNNECFIAINALNTNNVVGNSGQIALKIGELA